MISLFWRLSGKVLYLSPLSCPVSLALPFKLSSSHEITNLLAIFSHFFESPTQSWWLLSTQSSIGWQEYWKKKKKAGSRLVQAKCPLREWSSSCQELAPIPSSPLIFYSLWFSCARLASHGHASPLHQQPSLCWEAASDHQSPRCLCQWRILLAISVFLGVALNQWPLDTPWNRSSPTVLYLMQSPLGVTSMRLSQSNMHGPLPDSLPLLLLTLVCVLIYLLIC